MGDRLVSKKSGLLVFFALIMALAGCSKGEHWDGYVFPDKKNLLMHRSVGEFRSLDECETASLKILKSIDALQSGYFECGKNCKGSLQYERSCEDKVVGNYYKK